MTPMEMERKDIFDLLVRLLPRSYLSKADEVVCRP